MADKTKKDGLIKFINSHKTDIIAIFILISFCLVLSIWSGAGLKTLTGPIYGGDFYHQLGCVKHVSQGGNPFDNCIMLSDNPVYLPFYSILAGYYAKFTGLGEIDAMLSFAHIIMVLSALISYLLFKRLFNNPYIAATGALLVVPHFLVIKYTDFARAVMVPLLLFTLVNFYKKQDIKNSIILGVTIGLSTITHSTLLPVSFILMACLFVYQLNDEKLNKVNFDAIKKNFKKLLLNYLIVFVVSLPIIMSYWFEPIFKAGMQTSPHYLEWNGPGDMSTFALQFKILKDTFVKILFSFNSFEAIIRTLLVWCGIVFLFMLKKITKDIKFILFCGAVTLIAVFHYFLTVPLLGMHFVPNYVYSMIGVPFVLFMAMFGLHGIYKIVSKNSKLVGTIFLIAMLVLSAGIFISTKIKYVKGSNYEMGTKDLNPTQESLMKYVESNTNVNDVFLSTKEVSFMLNSLTGRKTVVSRRAHNDPYLEQDTREIAAAIIMYGNDIQTKKALLQKYEVKYFYWDYYWIQSEYHVDSQGQVSSWFDPLIAFKEDSHIESLEKNNVSYSIINTYVDPTLKDEFHPTFDLIFITPNNYRSVSHPWDENLDPLLEEVWNYEQNGQKIARLFKVKI